MTESQCPTTASVFQTILAGKAAWRAQSSHFSEVYDRMHACNWSNMADLERKSWFKDEFETWKDVHSYILLPVAEFNN